MTDTPDRVAWGWLAALAGLVVAAVAASSWLNHVEDVMFNGTPSLSDDELRARPTLERVLPGYVGALEDVADTVLAAEGDAGDPQAGVAPGDVDEDPWAADGFCRFAGDPSYRGEQAVDDLVVRQWDCTRYVEGAISADPSSWSGLAADLQVVASTYGFRPVDPSRAVYDPDRVLLYGQDSLGARILVEVGEDLSVAVDLTTGLHLSSGSEVVPEGTRRTPSRRNLPQPS